MRDLFSSSSSRCVARCAAGLALVLATSLLPAQHFQATATGTLSATDLCSAAGPPLGPGCPSPITTHSYSGPITTSPVTVFAGYAVVTAGMAGSSITVDAYSAATGSTVSQVNLQLTAPAQAGVRLQVSVASYSVVPASAVVGIAGQSYQFSQVVDAMTPSTGVLPVTISCSTPVSGFYSSGVTVTVSWSYPGVVVAGSPTPGCLGPAVAWTRGIPQLGNTGFGITCANAHPSLGGVSIIGLGGLSSTPFVYDSVNVWIDPNLPLGTLYLGSDAQGDILHPLALPADPSFNGMDLWAQFLLLEPPGCMPAGLSGSNAIRVTLQS